MILYAAILLLTGIALQAVSIAVYRGNVNLIHDYHQTKVTDKRAYGRAFGKALAVFFLGPLLGGPAAPLVGMTPSLGILTVGFAAGIGCILAVQRKYNKGIF